MTLGDFGARRSLKERYMKRRALKSIISTLVLSLAVSVVQGLAPAQAATSDPIVAFTPSGSTPANVGSTVTVDVVQPVSVVGTTSTQISQTWNEGQAGIQSSVYPVGWNLEYRVNGSWTDSAPSNPEKLSGIRTTGQVTSKGVSGTNQILTTSATSTLAPSGVSSFAASGRGDGWDAFVTNDYVLNVYHHDGNYRLECHLRTDGSLCDPNAVYQVDGYSTSTVSSGTVVGNKVYSFVGNNNREVGVICTDVSALPFTPCPTLFTSLGSDVDSANGGISSQVMVGTKIYATDMRNSKLLCFDTQTAAACSTPSVNIPNLAPTGNSTPGYMATFGDKIYLTANALYCFVPSTMAPCAGTWPAGSFNGTSTNAVPMRNKATLAITGACVLYRINACFTLTGASAQVPTGLLRLMNDSSKQYNAGPGYYESNAWTSSRMLWASNPGGNEWSESRATCYDWSTDSECAGFASNENLGSSRYSFRIYPADNEDCIWTNGDNGEISMFDVNSGSKGCARDNFKGQLTYSALAPALACDGGVNRIREFQSLTLSAPAGVSVTSLSVAVYGGDGNVVTGYEALTPNAQGLVDLSGLAVTDTTKQFRFEFSKVGLTKAQAKAITGTLAYTADPPELCVVLKLTAACPDPMPADATYPIDSLSVAITTTVTKGTAVATKTSNQSLARTDGVTDQCSWIRPQHGASQIGLNGEVTSIVWSPNGQLYVGGYFTNAGGDSKADYLARWGDNGWEAVGATSDSPINDRVAALAFTPDGKLLVGGHFSNAGGVDTADYFGIYDPVANSWSALPYNGTDSALDGRVRAIAVDSTNGIAYIGGAFRNAANTGADYVAAVQLTNNNAIVPVGTAGDITDNVNSLRIGPDGFLYVGGHFSNVGGNNSTTYAARWNGTTWQDITGAPNGMPCGYVWDFAWSPDVDHRYMYISSSCNGVRQWDSQTSTWSDLVSANGNGLEGGSIRKLLMLPNGTLYAGGSFTETGANNDASFIARWNGTDWLAISNASTATVTTQRGNCYGDGCWVWDVQKAPDGRIYFGGDMINAGGDAEADYLGIISTVKPADPVVPDEEVVVERKPTLPPIKTDGKLPAIKLTERTPIVTPDVTIPAESVTGSHGYIAVDANATKAYKINGKQAKQGLVTIPTNTMVQADTTLFAATDKVQGYLQLPTKEWIDLGQGVAGDTTFTMQPTVFLKPGRYELVATLVSTNNTIHGLLPTFNSAKTLRIVVYVIPPKASVTFKYRSAVLSAKAKSDLRVLAHGLRGAGKVTVVGYTQTDLTSKASKIANLKLSKARARAVARYLKAQGLDVRIIEVGRGATNPVSKKKQALNRRVDISYGF